MAQVEIEVKGLNRVRNNLRRLIALNREIVEPEMRIWAQAVRKLLKGKPYPSKRSGQTYVRTGELANGWAAEPHGLGVWSIVNRKEYAGWVVGMRQAWMHVQRWWQARPTIEGEVPKLTKALTSKIEGVWESG
jgi:hypothetical protein